MPDLIDVKLPNGWIICDCPVTISKRELAERIFNYAPSVFILCMESDPSFADALLTTEPLQARNTISFAALPDQPLNFSREGEN